MTFRRSEPSAVGPQLRQGALRLARPTALLLIGGSQSCHPNGVARAAPDDITRCAMVTMSFVIDPVIGANARKTCA